MDSPCVKACIADNAAAWAKLNELVAACACVDAVCKTECAADTCATPINNDTSATCGNCMLTTGQTACQGDLIACLGDATCQPVASCLMGCSSN